MEEREGRNTAMDGCKGERRVSGNNGKEKGMTGILKVKNKIEKNGKI